MFHTYICNIFNLKVYKPQNLKNVMQFSDLHGPGLTSFFNKPKPNAIIIIIIKTFYDGKKIKQDDRPDIRVKRQK